MNRLTRLLAIAWIVTGLSSLPVCGETGATWKLLALSVCRHYAQQGHQVTCSNSPSVKTGYYLNEICEGARLNRKFDEGAVAAWKASNTRVDETRFWSHLKFFGPNFSESSELREKGRIDWGLFAKRFPKYDGFMQLTPPGFSGSHCIIYADVYYPSGGKGELFQFNPKSLKLEHKFVMVTREAP